MKPVTSQVAAEPRHLRTPDTASPPRTNITPTSLTGGSRPRSSQPSFRSRLCHWPQAGILQDLFQPQDHIAPASLFSSLTQGTNPILFQIQYHPRPVFVKAPVHLTHSQRHPTLHLFQTSRTPAPENRHQPCLCSSPGVSPHLSEIQTRINPSPA